MMTRAILDAPLQTVEGAQPGTELKDPADQYLKALFPYHEADEKTRLRLLQDKLKEWVEGVEHIVVEPLPTITEKMRGARRRRRGYEQMKRVNKQMSRQVQRRLK